jgi:hypothetical protein
MARLGYPAEAGHGLQVIQDPTGQPVDGLMELNDFGTLAGDCRALS